MLCAIAFMTGRESGRRFSLRDARYHANGAITRKASSKNLNRSLMKKSVSNAAIAPTKPTARIAQPGRGKQ